MGNLRCQAPPAGLQQGHHGEMCHGCQGVGRCPSRFSKCSQARVILTESRF